MARLLPTPVTRWLLAALGGAHDDRFARVFHASPDWIVITRLSDSMVLDANHGFEQISGYQASEAIGKPIADLNIWHIPEQRARIVAELMQHGTVRNALAVARRRDGQLRDFMLSATLWSMDGTAPSHAVWIARDVTEVNAAAAALKESEARFIGLFDHAPLPMCYAVSSVGFTGTQWNQAWFDSFGFDPKSDQGKSGLELNIWVNPEDRRRVLEIAQLNRTHGDIDAMMRRKDGTQRLFTVSTRVFAEPDKTLLVSIYIDITEQRSTQLQIEALNSQLEARVTLRTAQLQTANRELSDTLGSLQLAKDQLVQSEKLAALGSLVAGVAHELNTPIGNGLTVASSLEFRAQEFAQLVETGLRRSDLHKFVEDTRLAAEIVARNLERAGQLVTSFKQVAVDQTSAQARLFSLHAVASEILLTLSAVIRKSGVQVTVDIPSSIMMRSYPGPLGQVLTNLINNALLHAFTAGEPGSMSLVASVNDKDMVTLRVSDTGKGIAPDNLNRIFEPFFTTKLGQGGSGLGLHIVHNIVGGALGGQIAVASTQGLGTTFTLTLPLVAPGVEGEVQLPA
ncbi:PAS domain-containing sensor histidine kinase [Rhodoferax aquaticus]|uniref:PAS domain-containing sensor histidine kinase n=1 Tax=Rhodoferax aquaticus TaxID=2527691 RepID=UPI00143D06BC|nr:ATP-binding protein [Rhodoferax aquaticus]